MFLEYQQFRFIGGELRGAENTNDFSLSVTDQVSELFQFTNFPFFLSQELAINQSPAI